MNSPSCVPNYIVRTKNKPDIYRDNGQWDFPLYIGNRKYTHITLSQTEYVNNALYSYKQASLKWRVSVLSWRKMASSVDLSKPRPSSVSHPESFEPYARFNLGPINMESGQIAVWTTIRAWNSIAWLRLIRDLFFTFPLVSKNFYALLSHLIFDH